MVTVARRQRNKTVAKVRPRSPRSVGRTGCFRNGSAKLGTVLCRTGADPSPASRRPAPNWVANGLRDGPFATQMAGDRAPSHGRRRAPGAGPAARTLGRPGRASCVPCPSMTITGDAPAKAERWTAQWKELVGQTRKYTIPLAEHFDADKITLRVGEVRRLRG